MVTTRRRPEAREDRGSRENGQAEGRCGEAQGGVVSHQVGRLKQPILKEVS